MSLNVFIMCIKSFQNDNAPDNFITERENKINVSCSKNYIIPVI